MPVNYEAARILLNTLFSEAERALLSGIECVPVPEDMAESVETVFHSHTQAYREVLVGCTIARLQDRDIDIRQPYVGLGENSFNGRTLDEKAVNPFFHDRRIPSSKGPYLSVFRRSVGLN